MEIITRGLGVSGTGSGSGPGGAFPRNYVASAIGIEIEFDELNAKVGLDSEVQFVVECESLMDVKMDVFDINVKVEVEDDKTLGIGI